MLRIEQLEPGVLAFDPERLSIDLGGLARLGKQPLPIDLDPVHIALLDLDRLKPLVAGNAGQEFRLVVSSDHNELARGSLLIAPVGRSAFIDLPGYEGLDLFDLAFVLASQYRQLDNWFVPLK